MGIFDRDQWTEIFEVIWMNKLRTVITGISVGWAIFMLVILMGGGNGLENGVKHMFRDDATNSLWIYGGSTSVSHEGLPVGREIRFDNADYDQLTKQNNIEHSTGRYYLRGEFNIKYGRETGSFSVRCVHPGHQHLENTVVTHGRYLNDTDNEELRKVAVIGRLVASQYWDDANEAIGEWLEIKGIPYRVVGVFEDSGGDREMQTIYLPINTVQLADNGNGRVHQMMVTTDTENIEEIKALEKDIAASLAQRYRFDESDDKAVQISNNLEQFQQFLTLFMGIDFIILLTGLLTLFAGIVAVSNIMLITVKERTREIGVKKALGATPKHIVMSILQESVVITTIAGYIGLVVGISLLAFAEFMLLTFEIETPFFRNPEVSWELGVGSVLLLGIAGLLGGAIPAYQASKISPVEAMNN